MVKTIRIAMVMVLAICLTLTASVSYSTELTDMARAKRPIKIFLGEFTNASDQAQIAPDQLKKEVEKALVARKSVSFTIAKSPQDSDVQVSSVIKGYQYMKRDPIKPSISFIMALDAVTSENYAELSAEFTVVNTATGSVAMKEDLTGFVKRMMTPAESLPIVYDKLARKFVADTFGKGE